jgi:integrase
MGFALPSVGIFNWQRPEKRDGAASTGSSANMQTAVAVQKPRISYSQFVQHQHQQEKYAPGSIADLIERRIEAAEKPGARPIGDSQWYTYRRLQKAPIGAIQPGALKVVDILEHARERKAGGVLPQTTMGDITALGSVLRYAADVWELPDTGLQTVRRAKSQLHREQLIASSRKRVRLPTEDELERLFALFEQQNQRPKNKIDMVLMTQAEILTGRRISELTRIERQHVDVEKRTCWLYNLKNSKGKGYHAEFALIEGAWELFERRLAEIPNEPTARLFPFNPHSVQRALHDGEEGARHRRAAHARQPREGVRAPADEGLQPAAGEEGRLAAQRPEQLRHLRAHHGRGPAQGARGEPSVCGGCMNACHAHPARS